MKIAIIIYIIVCLLGMELMLYPRKEEKESFSNWGISYNIVLSYHYYI